MASNSLWHETPLAPTTEAGASSFGECGNCGTRLTGPYCSQCGEKRLTPKDYSLSHLVEETLDVFTHFDSRFLRTLKALFTKPGELSRAYFRGGRSRYTKPLTVFVIINIIFFVVQPHTGLLHYQYDNYINNPAHSAQVRAHLLSTKEPEQAYATRFNANLQNQKKSLLIFSVPLLALAMAAMFIGTKRTYAEHLVFAVQAYTFLLVFLTALVFLLLLPLAAVLRYVGPAAAPVLRVVDSELGITIVTIAGLTIYMYFGLRRAYDASRVRAGLSAFAMAWVMGFLTGVYHDVLFYATFWTT